jgi:hypothetical protein
MQQPNIRPIEIGHFDDKIIEQRTPSRKGNGHSCGHDKEQKYRSAPNWRRLRLLQGYGLHRHTPTKRLAQPPRCDLRAPVASPGKQLGTTGLIFTSTSHIGNVN